MTDLETLAKELARALRSHIRAAIYWVDDPWPNINEDVFRILQQVSDESYKAGYDRGYKKGCDNTMKIIEKSMP